MVFIARIMHGAVSAGSIVACLAHSPGVSAAEGSWHSDADSGVRVRIPWDGALVKNARQVEGLILHRNAVEIPPGQRYTSAVYAPGGDPFVVMWTRHDDVAPTRRDLLDLAEARQGFGLTDLAVEPEALRGSGRLESTDSAGLKARVAFQIGRGATAFLGFYYSKDADAKDFDKIVASFELAPERRLAWEELPIGLPKLTQLLMAAAALMGFGLSAVFVAALRRKPRLLSHGEAASHATIGGGDDGLRQEG